MLTLLSRLLAPIALPIIAALLATNGLLTFGYWQRGKTIESKTAEIATVTQTLATCNASITLQNQAIQRLKVEGDAQVARAKQAARVASQIKAQGQVAMVRAASVPITGNCQKDMDALAKEFAK